MSVHESAENYLETILILSRSGSVRSIDVAAATGFSKPSISRAMKLLREDGYLEVDAGGYLSLTEKGRRTAGSIYERHTNLSEFLTLLGVDPDIAAEDACRIEHVISQQSFEAIAAFVRREKK
ncbi:MAG: metal-dependent transcriptional regulator [Oscillospiraceae bacterium]|nr:metal-dependent transcriptional regulator [Oscillospiraceae bacterium]